MEGDVSRKVQEAIEEAMAKIIGGCAMAGEPVVSLKITAAVFMDYDARTHPGRDFEYVTDYRADGHGLGTGRRVKHG